LDYDRSHDRNAVIVLATDYSGRHHQTRTCPNDRQTGAGN